MLRKAYTVTVETISIIWRGAILLVNWIIGAFSALCVAVFTLAMPYIAIGGDAGDATAAYVTTSIGVFVAVIIYCGAWFLLTARVLSDRAAAYPLMLFWVIPIFSFLRFLAAIQ